jgi:hypothetical protein
MAHTSAIFMAGLQTLSQLEMFLVALDFIKKFCKKILSVWGEGQ